MGRKKKDREASSSEEDSSKSKDDENSSSENDVKKVVDEEEAVRALKRRKRQTTEKSRDNNQDKNVERSRWESPDSRKRRHSPSGAAAENQQKRRGGHKDRHQEGTTKWDKNERVKESDRDRDRDIEKRRKEDTSRINKNERKDLQDRDYPQRENNRNNQGREREREKERERPVGRSDNRENQTRFEGRKSPRREDRNRRFEERDKHNNRNNNERGRQGGRSNRFSNNEGPRSRFDGSRIKSEPSPEWGKAKVKNEDDEKPVEKEKPNFEPSGKLTEDANTVNGVVIKYTEPLESRKPKRRWRLYPFKGEKALPTLYVHRQSAFLMGRDRKVADIPLDHPSCSKQHAALQFRLVSFEREHGGEGKRVRPYLIDLESANGTFVNDVKLEPRRYHELLERDVLKFGFSSREYVLLHEQSKDDALDDDVEIPAAAQE